MLMMLWFLAKSLTWLPFANETAAETRDAIHSNAV